MKAGFGCYQRTLVLNCVIFKNCPDDRREALKYVRNKFGVGANSFAATPNTSIGYFCMKPGFASRSSAPAIPLCPIETCPNLTN